MKNKEITIYELIGLIKDDKAPKKIKIDDDVWYFVKRYDGNYYIDKEEYCFHCCQLGFDYYIENDLLNKKIVEILPEENDEQHIEMQFPDTFEEFVKSYSFVDDKEIYTNGSELIPTFRLKQWIEHKKEENDEWEDIEEINSNADNTLFVMECYTGIPEKAQDWNFNILEIEINQLIKNQRKIIEILKNKD